MPISSLPAIIFELIPHDFNDSIYLSCINYSVRELSPKRGRNDSISIKNITHSNLIIRDITKKIIENQ